MKILQVNKYHYPRGGADRYYLDLGERLEAAGHTVAYFAMKHPKNLKTPWEKYFVSRVSYNENKWRYALKIPGRVFYSLEAKKKFSRLLKDFRPDIIHIHNIYHQISPSILDAAAKNGIPVVMHIHDYKLICPNHALFTHNKVCQKCTPGNYWPCIKNRCIKNSLTASCLAACEMYLHHQLLHIYEEKIKAYIAPSLFLKNLLVSVNWPENKIIVVNNAFRTDLSPIETTRDNYFLCYGRLSLEKGIDLVIKAVDKNPNFNLKIVGSGPEEKKLQLLANNAIKRKQIEFISWSEGTALAKLISEAQAVLIPSRWLENFPLTALESLSLGTPVIASNIGGLPEIVNTINGYLVKPEDSESLGIAMQDLLNDKNKFDKEQIINSSQKFSPEKNLEAVLNVYKNILKK